LAIARATQAAIFDGMKWTLLASLLTVASAPLAAQSRDYKDWRYRGEMVPDFKADSIRCATGTTAAGGTASSPGVSDWSTCIATAQWVPVRRWVPGGVCDPLTLKVAGYLPPELTPAAADSILKLLRKHALDRWVPSPAKHWTQWDGRVSLLVSASADSVSSRPLQATKGVVDDVPLQLTVRRPQGGAALSRGFEAQAEYAHACAGFRERPAAGVSEVFHWLQVDRQAKLDPRSPAPRWPASVRAGTEGKVLMTYVVDDKGRVEMETVKLESTTGLPFTDAVRAHLPRLRYFPGEIAGQYVRQIVLEAFYFR
jgi:hypothetical protein